MNAPTAARSSSRCREAGWRGDDAGPGPVETPRGRVAGLMGWENAMPLARFALYASGVQVYLAPTWNDGERWIASMQHIAFEGCCWVRGCGNVIRGADMA